MVTFNQWTGNIAIPANDFGQIYYITIPSTEPTREVIIRMKATDANATAFDPDLYVRWNDIPTRSSYDATDVSVNHEHVITLDASAGYTSGSKLYIGVLGYSSVGGNVQLFVELNSCEYSQCGGETRGTCDPVDGTCACNAGYQLAPYCQAHDSSLTIGANVTGLLGRQEIDYYNVTLPQPIASAWFRVTLHRHGRANGSTILALRKGGLPSISNNNGISYLFAFYDTATILLDANSYSAGDWTLGVLNTARGSFNYSLHTEVFYCANKCSNHGTCEISTSTCACESHYALQEDCSVRSHELHISTPQSLLLNAYDQYHFAIPVTSSIASSEVELGVLLTARNTSALPTHADYPRMYLTFGNHSIPSSTHFHVASARPGSWNQTFFLPTHVINEGTMRLLVQNGDIDGIEWVINMVLRPHCPFECHHHGVCSAMGTCTCAVGWVGGSCELDQTQCDTLAKTQHGVHLSSIVVTAVIIFALALGISVIVYSKFFYIEPPQELPELQYDPLAA